MSAKIYTGVRFKGSAEDILSELPHWQEHFLERCKDMELRQVAEGAVEEIDKRDVSDVSGANFPDLEMPPMQKVREERAEAIREIEMYSRRNPIIDPEFKVSLYLNNGKWYGMWRCEQDDWAKEWMEMAGVDEFNYWNGSDRPDDLSEEDWDSRRAVWSEIFSSHNVNTKSGFEAQIVPQRPFLTYGVDDVLNWVPDFELRLDRAARNALRDRMFGEYVERDQDWMAKVMRIHQEIGKFMESPDGQERLREVRLQCEDLMHPEITIDDLTGPYVPHMPDTSNIHGRNTP